MNDETNTDRRAQAKPDTGETYDSEGSEERVRGVIMGVAAMALAVAVFVALSYGIPKGEKAECIKWEQQAREFPNFYLTKWQDEQCIANGIIINATIK